MRELWGYGMGCVIVRARERTHAGDPSQHCQEDLRRRCAAINHVGVCQRQLCVSLPFVRLSTQIDP